MLLTAMQQLFKDIGLKEGNMEADDHVHNGSWYNCLGEKIGWGDVSKAELFKLASVIPDHECVYIVGERDSFWNAPVGGLDLAAIRDRARFTITGGTVTRHNEYREPKEQVFRSLEQYLAK